MMPTTRVTRRAGGLYQGDLSCVVVDVCLGFHNDGCRCCTLGFPLADVLRESLPVESLEFPVSPHPRNEFAMTVVY